MAGKDFLHPIPRERLGSLHATHSKLPIPRERLGGVHAIRRAKFRILNFLYSYLPQSLRYASLLVSEEAPEMCVSWCGASTTRTL